MDEEMVGLIPAAGKGMRLGLPYPKELYPVIRDNRYKPIAQFVLDNMVKAGLPHIILVVNETKHQLMGYFGNGQRFGTSLSYVVQEQRNGDDESTSPGLAHALDSAYLLTRGKTVVFGMADTIMRPLGILAMGRDVLEPADDLLLVLFDTDRPEKGGMVRSDSERRVVDIVDKPAKTDLTQTWGCIIWRPRFTEFLHRAVVENGVSDFADIMNDALAQGMQLRSLAVEGATYIDLGTYEEIMELDRRFRK